MKLKFKNQSYQDDAVQSVVDVFEGQSRGYRKDLMARYKTTEGRKYIRSSGAACRP